MPLVLLQIFLRFNAQKTLDHKRHDIVVKASVRLSSFVKAMLSRKQYSRKKKAAVLIQKGLPFIRNQKVPQVPHLSFFSVIRGTIARKHYHLARESVVKIQASKLLHSTLSPLPSLLVS